MTILATTVLVTASAVFGIPLASMTARLSRMAFDAVMDWLFISYSLQDPQTIDVLMRYFTHNARGVSFRENRYEVFTRWIPRLKDRRHVFFLHTTRSNKLFWYRSVPILYRPSRPISMVSSSSSSSSSVPCFVALRGSVSWNSILLEAAEWSDAHNRELEAQQRFFYVQRFTGSRKNNSSDLSSAPSIGKTGVPEEGTHREAIGWTAEDFREPQEKKFMDAASLSTEMKTVIKNFEFWKKNEPWHRDRGVPWRWGCLLYGPPGSGKTSLVNTIAHDFDVPVAVFDLATMDNHDFIRCWQETRQMAGSCRIVLLEDFDTVFNGRVNVQPKSDLAFETILNAVDGIEKQDGTALFVTTNHLDKIDEAMGQPLEDGSSSRPGRIDLISHIGHMDRAGRVKLAVRILRDQTLAERLADEFKDDVPAQFQNRCVLKAKEILWQKNT